LNGRLLLSRDAASGADVQLTGTPLSLLALLREDPAAVIRRGDVMLTGDAEAGQRFQELTQLLRPDLEAGLARIIGDIPAYGVGSLLRKAAAWGRSSATTQAVNIGEYLAHERHVLVPRAEAQQFLEEVDALRESTDRLEARIAELESSRSNA
jgi:ubiquinone biosynthesis protein UbiJ